MPSGTIPINISNDFHYANQTVDDLLFDTGIGGPWTFIDLTLTVTDLGGLSTTFGLYSEENYQTPGVNTKCVVTPPIGVTYHWTCDTSADQPTSLQIRVYPRGGLTFPRTLRINATGTVAFTNAGNCTYGTRPKAGVSFVYYLTPGLLDTWLAATGLAWMAPVLTALWFSSIDLTGICGTGPGPIPTLDTSVLNWSPEQALSFVKAVAWYSLCECSPGTPPPIPFPSPSTPPPSGLPSAPLFPCSDIDPCAAISQIAAQVAWMSRQVSSINSNTTLLQRYRLPFAYIKGSGHLNLTGTGSFSIPTGLLGLQLIVDATPVGVRTSPGNPVYNFDLGWVSVLDTNGFIAERRVTRSSEVWIPQIMQTAMTFGFNLNPGVTLRVTELLAEP